MKTAHNRDWESLVLKIDRISAEFARNVDFHPDQQICDLLILGEDHRFNLHPGVDLIALCRAAWRTYMCGCREGGSTIAMQLVRTVTGRRELTLSRKLSEIRLAIKLTKYIPKENIPSLYVWVAYYGWKMNGFLQACNKLRIDPNSIRLLEAANLVASLKYPQPKIVGPERSKRIEQRAQYLIRRYQKSKSNPKSQFSMLKWNPSK